MSVTLIARTEVGAELPLPQPLELTLRREAAAPADELKALFAVSHPLPPLCRLSMSMDGSAIFSGIVDEQHTELTASGVRVTLVCRSLAALLLDNEAKPETTRTATRDRLQSALLTPLGLTFAEEELPALTAPVAVTKGESCWSVLARLLPEVWVDTDGLVHVTARSPKEYALCDVTAAKYSYLPCELLSEVWQQSTRRTYDTCWQSGHCPTPRRRYLSLQQGKNPKELLAESLASSRALTVTCKGAWLCEPGDTATVTLPHMGTVTQCPISSICYTRSSSGELTRITLALQEQEGALCG